MVAPAELVQAFVVDLLTLFAIYLIVNLSLNMEFGYTGIPNFGKVLAVAGGAFVVGSFPGRLLAELFGLTKGIEAYSHIPVLAECVKGLAFRKPTVLEGMKYIEDNVIITTCLTRLLASDVLLSISVLILTVLMAAAVGALLGFVASYPAIRLREDYLAMTLLGMAEFLQVIGYNYPELVGGTLGVALPDVYYWAGGAGRFIVAAFMLLLAALLLYVYFEAMSRSPLARVLKAVRDKEIAAEVMGKDVIKIRQKVIVFSSAIAAVGGALWAFQVGGVIAVSYERVSWTFWPWVMVIIGGAGNNRGILLGTAVFVTARKLIDFYKFALEPLVPFSVIWLDRLLLGIVLIAILIARPEGILPERPKLTLKREEVLAIRARIADKEKAAV